MQRGLERDVTRCLLCSWFLLLGYWKIFVCAFRIISHKASRRTSTKTAPFGAVDDCSSLRILQRRPESNNDFWTTLLQVEPIEIHHFAKRANKVLDELLLGIIARIHLGDRSQL